MHKIFINDTSLLIAKPTDVFSPNLEHLQLSLFTENDKLFDSIAHLNARSGLVIIHENPDDFLNLLIKRHKYIEAAGGLVTNEFKELLMIKRLGYWDLPKGKVELNELIADAAVREVEEECTIKGINRLTEAQSTYHAYKLKGNWFVKKTFWFHMYAPKQQLSPQIEEGIEIADWYSRHQVEALLPYCYRSIANLIHQEYLC